MNNCEVCFKPCEGRRCAKHPEVFDLIYKEIRENPSIGLECRMQEIFEGDARRILAEMEPGSVSMAMTSPPYYSLRSYQAEPLIWDAADGCEHEWGPEKVVSRGHPGNKSTLVGTQTAQISKAANHSGQFCLKCHAWRGQLGSEPTPDLYIKHLCDIFDQVKRVLAPWGTLWVNLDDTSNSAASSQSENLGNAAALAAIGHRGFVVNDIPTRTLIGIPARFQLEMIRRGWVNFDTVIWHKPNVMPDSDQHGFTCDYEFIYCFAKSSQALFWHNEKTLQMVGKKPPGLHGGENVDWEWEKCAKCSLPQSGPNTALQNKEPYQGNNPHTMRLAPGRPSACNPADKSCARKIKYGHCDGAGNVKKLLWHGHTYFFDQQFEPAKSVALIATNGVEYNHENEDLLEVQNNTPGDRVLPEAEQAQWAECAMPEMLEVKDKGMASDTERQGKLSKISIQMGTLGERSGKTESMATFPPKAGLCETLPEITKGEGEPAPSEYQSQEKRKPQEILCYREGEGSIIPQKPNTSGQSLSSKSKCPAQNENKAGQGDCGGVDRNKKEIPSSVHLLRAEETAHDGALSSFEQGGQTRGKEYSPSLSVMQCQAKKSSSINQPLRHRRSVWSISTRSYRGAHYAVYPEELCRTPILAGCPAAVCQKCGLPRVKIYRITEKHLLPPCSEDRGMNPDGMARNQSFHQYDKAKHEFEYSDCGCHVGYAPGIVLDPFAGTSATLAMAKRLGRRSIGIELSEKYCKLSAQRIESTQAPLDHWLV